MAALGREDSPTSTDAVSDEDLQQIENWLVKCDSGKKASVVKFRARALSSSDHIQIGKILGLTFKTTQSDVWLVASLLNAHGFTEVPQNSSDFNLLWTGSHPRPHTFSALKSYQRVNHFPRSYELTRKDRLYKNIIKLQHMFGAKHFDFIPPSYVMPCEYRDFWSSHHRLHGPWIVKPVASSRGRGIYLVNKPEEVPIEESVIVSKYVNNPLLVDGHKCDLRLYVAVTSFDPLVIYLYRHGLVRFAAVKYSSDQSSLDNPCIHLCNYSINKYHADFVVAEDPSAEDVGHKRSLSCLLRWLRTQGRDPSLLMRRIEDLVVKSLMAAVPAVSSACRMFVPHRNNCFEIFGFDVLVDSDLKPWLLEVNLSPSLACESQLDLRIKSALVADLLTLVGLPAIDPTSPPTPPTRQGRARTPASAAERSQCRRAVSADAHRNRGAKPTSRAAKLTASTPLLTAEEQRVLIQLRDENERRGDFVRIFPTASTWTQYGEYLESLHAATATSSPFTSLNRVIHEQLFPVQPAEVSAKLPPKVPRHQRHGRQVRSAAQARQLMSPGSTTLYRGWKSLNEDSEPDDLKLSPPSLYEQAVLQNVLTEPGGSLLSMNSSHVNGSSLTETKEDLCKLLEEGKHTLSMEQARSGFSRYLRFVLQRLPIVESASDGEWQLDLIEKFLQKIAGAPTRHRAASPAKSPTKRMANRDRVAVISSKLGEFIDRYERDPLQAATTHRPDCEGIKAQPVDSQLWSHFLSTAGEKDLEDILIQYVRQAPCCHFLLGRCQAPRDVTVSSVSKGLNLLREACHLAVNRPVLSRKKTEDDNSNNAAGSRVVTFDLAWTATKTKTTSPVRAGRAGILKREKSM